MLRSIAAGAFAAALLVATPLAFAKDAKPSTPKPGKDEKLCQYKFPSGEKRAWVCKKEEPCCAWDAISYVKCGSTITGCL